MKRTVYIFVIIVFALFVAENVAGQVESTIDKVVIDAGHGGKDPGAVSKNAYEKDIVLSIALKTGKLIEENFEDVDVVYTRKTDDFVELHKRAQIANESGADLFISIHCNSNNSSKPFGAETFVMGLHKSEANLDVAKTENAAIFYEDDYNVQYEGFNPNSDEDYIILSMFQSSNMNQSINFSSKVQRSITEKTGRKDRGVKQAGFWVLYKTTMPGVLIETGFISNPEEEKYLITEKGQQDMAGAIFNAFSDYKKEYEEMNLLIEPKVVKIDSSELLPEKVVAFRVQFASYKKEKTLDF
ncbi:MAG: N-acetylmuramoyl-L-alanine amidase, partial [Bacteroidales bacterium]|nr:N-acetylmuramoyl-L-alanine amidase [Bacteroidales bacterium]